MYINTHTNSWPNPLPASTSHYIITESSDYEGWKSSTYYRLWMSHMTGLHASEHHRDEWTLIRSVLFLLTIYIGN